MHNICKKKKLYTLSNKIESKNFHVNPHALYTWEETVTVD